MNRGLSIVAAGLRVVVVGIFLYAGVLKIWDFSAQQWATPQFFEDILNYQLGSWSVTLGRFKLALWDVLMVTAVYLPWLEVVAAVALLTRRLRLGAAWLLAGLMLAFTALLGSAWARGLDISCGCFGRGEGGATDYPVLLTRDLLLLGALGVVLWAEHRRLRSGFDKAPAVSEAT